MKPKNNAGAPAVSAASPGSVLLVSTPSGKSTWAQEYMGSFATDVQCLSDEDSSTRLVFLDRCELSQNLFSLQSVNRLWGSHSKPPTRAVLAHEGDTYTASELYKSIGGRLASMDLRSTLVMEMGTRHVMYLDNKREMLTLSPIWKDRGSVTRTADSIKDTFELAIRIVCSCDLAEAAKYLDCENNVIRRIMRARVHGWI